MTPQDDVSHSVVLPNHPFRTSTQEAMRTLSAGVGKGSNKAQGRRSSRASNSLQSQIRNHSTIAIQQMPQKERSSTVSPQKATKDTLLLPIEGGNVEHDLTFPPQTPKTTFANRLSRLFVCGRNPAIYDQEVAIGLQALTPAKQSPIRPSMKRRSSFFSLSARYQTSPDVEFEETYITNTFPVQLEVENDEPNLLIKNNEPYLHIESNIPDEKLNEPPAEIQQVDEQEAKGSALHRSTGSKARRYDTIPSSEACEYTGRKNSSAIETKASSSSLNQLPTQPPEESKLNYDRQESQQKNKGKLPLPEIPNRRNSARSLRSYVSSSSLYSAASAQERAFVNTPGEVSLADDWGMSASPSRSITSTQLGQSPFMFDLLAKFPGLSSSTTQQPSGLRHMLDSESIIEGERVKTPHPPGFMPDEESDVEQELFQQNKNDTPPARLRREGATTMQEAASPTSSLSNSTLETPSPPIASMNRKRLAMLNGSRLENNFAKRMASMENADTDWRDNLIGLYTDDDIIVPFPQAASHHRQSVSSTTDSFHSTNLYQSIEEENPPISVNYGDQKLYDTAPVPPPAVPLPPIPAQHQSLSKSQRTIRKASIGNRHRGNSDASAHSNATMKAGNRSKHSRRA